MAAKAKGIVPVLKVGTPEFEGAFQKLMNRRDNESQDVEKVVRKIIERVRDGGHKELIACVKKYDGSGLDALEVTREEWDEAADTIDPADRAALDSMAVCAAECRTYYAPPLTSLSLSLSFSFSLA